MWIREQGLPHLNAYCSLKFNVKAVKDSMTEFITFKETVEVSIALSSCTNAPVLL